MHICYWSLLSLVAFGIIYVPFISYISSLAYEGNVQDFYSKRNVAAGELYDIQLPTLTCGKYTWKDREILENGFGEPLNPQLVDLIHCYWIKLGARGPLNLKEPWKIHFSQYNQSRILDEFMEAKRNGFYVECGAGNGEELSNTLFFERNRNWTGLLVEPNPTLFHEMMQKNRKSYMINACLNTKQTTGRYEFDPIPLLGGLVHEMKESHIRVINSQYANILVQCFSFHSIMKALGRTHVDVFSLDVEGAEVGILETIPFNQITIDIFLIEFKEKGSKRDTLAKLNKLKITLEAKGYRLVGMLKIDLLFVRKDKINKVSLKTWRGKFEAETDI